MRQKGDDGGHDQRKEELSRQIHIDNIVSMDWKVMRSTGTCHGQQEFGQEELVKDLFIEGKSLIDREV